MATKAGAKTGRGLARVIFSGIQPTGVPHLGNYAGALRQWVSLQNQEPSTTKLIYSIVDLHAITTPQPPDQLRKWRREALASLLAIGIDPDRCVLFHQSSVRQEARSLSNWKSLTQPLFSGSPSLRTDVDPELHGFGGIPIANDTMEGK